MKHIKHLLKSMPLALLCLATHSAIAQAAPTANLDVSATVISNCLITTNPVAFPNYDPTSTTAPTTAQQGKINIICTPGSANTKIGLDSGKGASCPSGTSRCMTGAITPASKLSYELYQPSDTKPNATCGPVPGTTIWNTANSLAVGAAPNLSSRTYNVCGYLPPSQSVPADNYKDTVTVTVTF
jgi:spore coat protein U-like protein